MKKKAETLLMIGLFILSLFLWAIAIYLMLSE